ncbi:unnamed protein product [Auanema sp. JU1783]|nr:unnamed protein product [Auanema sp. JU1783]
MLYLSTLFLLLASAYAAPLDTKVHDSPILVTIDTDASKSLHLGPYDRTRFDLIETFHPLQTASVARADQIALLKQKAQAQGVKVSEGQVGSDAPAKDGEVLLHASKPEQVQERVVFGEYTPWTAWTGCVNGERSRVRTCVSKRPGLKIVCHGPNKEVQNCFSTEEHFTAVAADPWTIEKEINGDFLSDQFKTL